MVGIHQFEEQLGRRRLRCPSLSQRENVLIELKENICIELAVRSREREGERERGREQVREGEGEREKGGGRERD